jgi:hypothetical protein
VGGSGGGGFFDRSSPEEVQRAIRDLEDRTRNQAFDIEVSTSLGEILAEYDHRDVVGVSRALEQVKSALESQIEGSIDARFGGSVRKHTYVDGVSDVDALLFLRDQELSSMSPQTVLDYFEERLSDKMAGWQASRGRLSVELRKGDIILQLLPAVREGNVTRIPSDTDDRWSRINPSAFFRHLTRANEHLGNKLVPTIKLVKIINAVQPQAMRLSGYHIESLAIEVFKNYDGPQNPKAMLEHFFDKAPVAVLRPITDKSGQSVHVDDYMGPANSEARRSASAGLNRIARQMKNANAMGSKREWLGILGED